MALLSLTNRMENSAVTSSHVKWKIPRRHSQQQMHHDENYLSKPGRTQPESGSDCEDIAQLLKQGFDLYKEDSDMTSQKPPRAAQLRSRENSTLFKPTFATMARRTSSDALQKQLEEAQSQRITRMDSQHNNRQDGTGNGNNSRSLLSGRKGRRTWKLPGGKMTRRHSAPSDCQDGGRVANKRSSSHIRSNFINQGAFTKLSSSQTPQSIAARNRIINNEQQPVKLSARAHNYHVTTKINQSETSPDDAHVDDIKLLHSENPRQLKSAQETSSSDDTSQESVKEILVLNRIPSTGEFVGKHQKNLSLMTNDSMRSDALFPGKSSSTELPQIRTARPGSAKSRQSSSKDSINVLPISYQKKDLISVSNIPYQNIDNMPQRVEKPMATSNTTCSNTSLNGESTTDTRSDGAKKLKTVNSAATTRSIKTRSPASAIEDHPQSGDSSQALETLFEQTQRTSANNNVTSTRKKIPHSKSAADTEIKCLSSSNRTHSYGSLQNGNHRNNKHDDMTTTKQSRVGGKLPRQASDLGMITRQTSNLSLRPQTQPHNNKPSGKKPPSIDTSRAEFFLDDDSRSDHEEEKRYFILDWLNGVHESELETPMSPIIDEDKPTQTDTAFHIVYNGD